MMEGARHAKELVNSYLAADVPARLVSFRNGWGFDSIRLPTPQKFIDYETLILDHWPTIMSLVDSTLSMERIDWDGNEDPIYRVKYAMRTYVWVRAAGPDNVTNIRDDLTTVVRDALLDHPALREVDRFAYCEPHIDEGTMTEEFSDLTLVKGDRMLAGAYLAYTLGVDETVTRKLLSDTTTLSTILTVEQISKVPNAPTHVLAVPGVTQASLTWHASTWDGGSMTALTSYRIEQSIDGGTTWTVAVTDTNSLPPTYVVSGLTTGTSYQFRVAAINGVGVGAFSTASNTVIPT